MRRFLAILLLLIYTTSVFGVTVHVHYCMKKYAGISFLHNKNQACKKCGMKNTKNGCCKDEQKKILLKTDHQQGLNTFVKTPPAQKIAFALFHTEYNISSPSFNIPYAVHAPPILQKNELHILNSVFLI